MKMVGSKRRNLLSDLNLMKKIGKNYLNCAASVTL